MCPRIEAEAQERIWRDNNIPQIWEKCKVNVKNTLKQRRTSISFSAWPLLCYSLYLTELIGLHFYLKLRKKQLIMTSNSKVFWKVNVWTDNLSQWCENKKWTSLCMWQFQLSSHGGKITWDYGKCTIPHTDLTNLLFSIYLTTKGWTTCRYMIQACCFISSK